MKGYEMKRFWLFFCALWGLSWLFQVNATEFKVSGLTYEVLSEEKRTVSIIDAVYGPNEIPSVVTWEDVSYTVVAIGDKAFMYHSDHCVWKIPETITEIGDSAFMSAGDVCSKIRVPQNVVLGKDVFTFTDLWVPKEYEENYLNDSRWNRYSIGGYINEGGLAYCLYEEYENKRADVLPFYDNGDNACPSGKMVIPNSIEYNDSVYQVWKVKLLYDCPDVLHIDAYCSCSIMEVYNLSNLMDIRFHSVVANIRLDNCVSLRSIEIAEPVVYSLFVNECPLLDSVFFRKRVYDVSNLEFFMNSDAPSNVYFPFNIPPVITSDENINRNLVVHVPKGAKNAYMESAWSMCEIVDDLQEVTDVVEWGYSERGRIAAFGMVVGGGDKDVEFAMRVPKEYLQAYKGAKITKINFCTREVAINEYHDNDVEYVFVARRGTNEYLAKVPVSVVRGTWMEIPLPEPLLIDGEELMVGIGRHGVLGANWASSDICADGMWLRVMGNDMGGNVPVRWIQNAGYVDWNHSLPITFTIEGENLPQDIATLRMQVERNQGEVTKSSRTERMEGKAKNMVVKDGGEAFYGAYDIVCTGDSIERFSVLKPDMATQGRSVRFASPQYRQTSSAKVKMTVQNRAPEKISSFRIVGTGNEGVVLDTVMHHTLMVNQAKEVEVELVLSAGHRYQEIDLSIAEVDGISDEILCNSDTTILFISPVQQPYDRKVVVEAAVATWCGYSVSGLQGIEEMEERFPDNFIGIMTHYNDEMAPDESYSAIFDYFGGSTPKCIVNRKEDCITDPGITDIEPFVLAEMGDADAEISVQAYLMGNGSRKVRACTTTRFGYDANDNHCKIAYAVLENCVGPYIQRNYYSGGTPGNGYVEGWSEKPSSVSTLYDNVARGIIEYDGVEGSTPMMVKTDEAYQYEYVFDLPSNVEHVENVEIVALLIDGYTGEILNADITKLVEDPNGIHDVNIGNEGHVKFSICDGRIVPNMDCELFVYTIDGKAVANRNLSAGLYIVKAVCNGNVTTCKMAVE